MQVNIPDRFVRENYSTFKEIVIDDSYRLRKYRDGCFDYIIDIGANNGVFVDYARYRHPYTPIYAFEPCKDTNMRLQLLTGHMRIIFSEFALGNGKDMYFLDTGYSTANMFFVENIDNTYTVKSISLPDMFKVYSLDITKKFFLKIDCEGGEQYILNDKGSEEIIRSSVQTALEIHFPCKKHSRFNSLPTWKEYTDWIHTCFDKTHNILYHMGNRKDGHGTYIIEHKDAKQLQDC